MVSGRQNPLRKRMTHDWVRPCPFMAVICCLSFMHRWFTLYLIPNEQYVNHHYSNTILICIYIYIYIYIYNNFIAHMDGSWLSGKDARYNSGRRWLSLRFWGPRFATCIHLMKQLAHNWYLPFCQCTETCYHVSSIQNDMYNNHIVGQFINISRGRHKIVFKWQYTSLLFHPKALYIYV